MPDITTNQAITYTINNEHNQFFGSKIEHP